MPSIGEREVEDALAAVGFGRERAADLRTLPGIGDERVQAWQGVDGLVVLANESAGVVHCVVPLADATVLEEQHPEAGRLWSSTVAVEPGVTVLCPVPVAERRLPALLGAAGTVDAEGLVVTARGEPGTAVPVEVLDADGRQRPVGVIIFDSDGVVTRLGPWTTSDGTYVHLPDAAGTTTLVADWTPAPALTSLLDGRPARVVVDAPTAALRRVRVDGVDVDAIPSSTGVELDVHVAASVTRRIELELHELPAGSLRDVRVAGLPRRTISRFRGPVDVGGSTWLETAVTMPMDWETTPGVTIADTVAFHGRRPAPDGAVYEGGVVYGTAGAAGRPLTLDLYRRAVTSERRPVVLFVHGGGWASGDPWFHLRQAHAFAARGYVTATIRYRLQPEARWPAAIEDASCAVRWIRATAAELGADPDRIAVAGGSAGGQLAAMLALRPGANEGRGGHRGVRADVQAAVLWYPAVDIAAVASDAAFAALLTDYFGEPSEARWREASPVTWVHPGAPPVLTITGGADSLTTVSSIEAFHRALEAAGVRQHLEVVPDRDHAFDLLGGDDWHRSLALATTFLDDVFEHAWPS